MKELSDSRNNAKDTTLEMGDIVLVKQPKTDKWAAPYKPVPYEVVEKRGTMITAASGNHTITGYSSHMKKMPQYWAEAPVGSTIR